MRSLVEENGSIDKGKVIILSPFSVKIASLGKSKLHPFRLYGYGVVDTFPLCHQTHHHL